MSRSRLPPSLAVPALAALVLASLAGRPDAQEATPAASQPAPATAAPATPAPAAPGQAAPQAGVPATVVDDRDIGSVLGKTVLSPKGEDMGRIVDILVDRTGRLRAAVIDFGGFFGVGTRKVAVEWRTLHFRTDPKADTIVEDLPRDEIRSAPVYKEGEPVVIIGPAPAPAQEKAEAPAAASAAASPTPPATPP